MNSVNGHKPAQVGVEEAKTQSDEVTAKHQFSDLDVREFLDIISSINY